MELLYLLYKFDMIFNILAQNTFQSYEGVFVFVSKQLGPSSIVDVLLPLLGAIDMQLMIKLNLHLGVVNICASVLKWIIPGHRPYWWTREFNGPTIRHHALTCETTTGFPSAHSMCFTCFVYTVGLYAISQLVESFGCEQFITTTILVMVWLSSSLMWYTRLYFGCHFLHQCLAGSYLGYFAVNFIDKYNYEIYHVNKVICITMVLATVLFVFAVYHLSQLVKGDPLWSVKMGTRWCQNPNEIKQYSSPIPSFSRDFGILTGVALSAPLIQRENVSFDLMTSLPCALGWVIVNQYARKSAPGDPEGTQFIVYEFIRNMIHSYVLITVFPSYTGIKIPEFSALKIVHI